jgi:hypothetical protein
MKGGHPICEPLKNENKQNICQCGNHLKMGVEPVAKIFEK